MKWNETKEQTSIKQRPREEVQKEYQALCETAGDKQFQVSTLQAQLYLINEKLFKLSEEFEILNKPQKENLSAP